MKLSILGAGAVLASFHLSGLLAMPVAAQEAAHQSTSPASQGEPAAAPNVFWYHHWWSTEDWEGSKSYLEYADQRRVQYSRQDGHTRAKLGYSMKGRFVSDVYATQESGSFTWLTQSGVWVGDVLWVKVPGAAPGQLSTLRISAEVAYAGEGRGYTEALVCAGFIDATHCQDDVVNVNGRLRLPAARHVAELQRVSPQDLQVVIVGDEALVPVRFFMMNNVSGAPGEPEMNKRMDMTVSLELPAGATCTSRSGQAFQGACPAPRP